MGGGEERMMMMEGEQTDKQVEAGPGWLVTTPVTAPRSPLGILNTETSTRRIYTIAL